MLLYSREVLSTLDMHQYLRKAELVAEDSYFGSSNLTSEARIQDAQRKLHNILRIWQ